VWFWFLCITCKPGSLIYIGDELKPRCENCTGRRLICRYGVQLSFLQANTFTLLPEEAQALQDSSPRSYKSLKVSSPSVIPIALSHIQKFVDGLNDSSNHIDHSVPGTEFSNVDIDSTPQNFVNTPDIQATDEEWHSVNGYDEISKDWRATEMHQIHQYRHHQTVLAHHSLTNDSPNHSNVNHQQPATFTPTSIPQTNISGEIGMFNEANHERNVYKSILSEPRTRAIASSSIDDQISSMDHYTSSPHTTGDTTNITPSLRSEAGLRKHNSSNELLKIYIDEVAPWVRRNITWNMILMLHDFAKRISAGYLYN
jgi:hypothetical protein